jgi:3-oxoacid CoA-transferase A subunit
MNKGLRADRQRKSPPAVAVSSCAHLSGATCASIGMAGSLDRMVGDLTMPNGDRMRKTIKVAEAIARISDGASLMIGGFMAVGTPPRLIDETVRQGKKDLTIIANDTARPGVGIGKLIDAKLVRRVITSHIGTNPETQRQMLAGEIEVELVPQGTLAERIRAGGYGLGGVLTPTGAGTLVEEGKQALASSQLPKVCS